MNLKEHSGIVGADDTPISLHGIRIIFFKMLPGRDVAVGIAFTTCAVQEPVISFPHNTNICYGCSLTNERMKLKSDKDFNIPIHHERHHVYPKPRALIQDMGDCHAMSVLT